MNPHDLLKLAGGVMALGLFVPMIVEIVRTRGAGQSFATWGLWTALDSMLTITLWQQHGNYLLSLGFAMGGVFLSAVLLAQGDRPGAIRQLQAAVALVAVFAVGCSADGWTGGRAAGGS